MNGGKWGESSVVKPVPSGKHLGAQPLASMSCRPAPPPASVAMTMPPIMKFDPSGNCSKALVRACSHSRTVSMSTATATFGSPMPTTRQASSASSAKGRGHQVFKLDPPAVLLTVARPASPAKGPDTLTGRRRSDRHNGDIFVTTATARRPRGKFAKMAVKSKNGAGPDRDGRVHSRLRSTIDPQGRNLRRRPIKKPAQIFDQDGNYLF